MSFGRITAKGVDINAGNGVVTLASAAGKPSVKATGGDIDLTAGKVLASAGSLNLDATGDIVIHGLVSNGGNVGMTAGSSISVGTIKSGKNVSLTAKGYLTNTGNLDISAASNITSRGEIGTGWYERINGSVHLKAAGTISLDHGVFVGSDNIDITGGHLAYTGKGAFTLSAGYGTIALDASIGSAAAPVKYAVDIQEKGYGIFLQRSIYTNASIDVSANAFALDSTGGGPFPVATPLDIGNITVRHIH